MKTYLYFLYIPNNVTNKIIGYTNKAISGKGIQYICDKGCDKTAEQERVSFISQKLHPTAGASVAKKYKLVASSTVKIQS